MGMRGLLVLFLVVAVSSHGQLTKPVSRAGSRMSTSGTCAFDRCAWYTNYTEIPGEPTNNDPQLLTMGVEPFSKEDVYRKNPWRAPGSAPVLSPCGNTAQEQENVDGRDLPLGPRDIWVAGSTAEVAFGQHANHGGGYAYRLCRVDSDLSEECFQNHHLEFDGDHSWVQFGDDESTRVQIRAQRISKDTQPAGSQWTKNPIPSTPGMFPAQVPWAEGHQSLLFNVIDKVKVPNALPAGDYVLSWRWDCEENAQIWLNCGDVTVLPEGSPLPARTTPSPPTSPSAEVVWKWDARAGISARAAVDSKNGVLYQGIQPYMGDHQAPGFQALDLATGHPLWAIPVETDVTGGAVLGDGVDGVDGYVYFCTAGWMYALDSRGNIVWKFDFNFHDYFATPVLWGTLVFVGTFDAFFYAVDAQSGELVWKFDTEGQAGYTTAAVSDDGVVYFSARYDKLFALNATSGAMLWQVLGGAAYSAPVVSDGLVFVGTSNGTMDAYDAHTGELRWQFAAGAGVWALNGAAVADSTVYFGSDDSCMYAVTAIAGELVWRTRVRGPVEALPFVFEQSVLTTSFDGCVYSFNRATGKEEWHFQTGAAMQTAPVVDSNGIVYAGSYDQVLYALRQPKISR